MLSLEEMRVRVKKFMTTSTFGQNYNNVLLLISVASSIEYMYQTYLDPTDHPNAILLNNLNIVEKILASLFMFDWCLNYFMADHKLIFMTSFFSMVDILTVVPIWVTDNQSPPIVFEVNNFDSGLMYLLFLLSTTRVLRALRINRKLINVKDAVNRCIGEITLAILVMILFFAAVMQFLESNYQPYSFHVWMYYILVTIATVGYGDIAPQSTLGRIAAMALIGFAIITIPRMTNELVEKMGLQSVYARASYTPKGRFSKHIVICGDISSTAVVDFFEELFHDDHENSHLNAVLLLPEPPTVEMILLMRQTKYICAISYLEGSALLDVDLKRAKVELADAVFIMTNKFGLAPDEEDAKAILHNLSIQRYMNSHRKMNGGSSDTELLYCMQLVRPENLRLMSKDDVVELDAAHVVICLNEIKMGVLAKSLIYPGANTFIMNLITTFADEDDEEEAEEVGSLSGRSWIKEYQKGCDWEIYVTPLSDMFVNALFCDLSYSLYEKFGVVLFALQVEDLKLENSARLFLNPAEYKIPSKEHFKVNAFVMAKNKAQSDLTFPGGHQGVGESIAGAFNLLRGEGLGGTEINRLKAEGRSRSRSNFFGLRGSSADNSTGDADNNSPSSPTSGSEKSGQKAAPKKSKWGLLKKSAIMEKKVQSMSRQEIMQELEDSHIMQNYYIRAFPPELRDVTVNVSVLDEYPHVDNHLIITGKGLSSVYDLIRPLRAKYLGPMQYIVILSPNDIPFDIWQRISMFDAILFVRGSPLEEANLHRAGIFKAARVVVLADGISSASNSSNSSGASQSSDEALVDSDAIFTYQCVHRMNPFAHVVVEVVHHSNISYLESDQSHASTGDYKCTPQFAAGTLFTTSLLDTLVCQAYYNPLIIKVVNKLISGVDLMERADLISQAAKRAEENDMPTAEANSSDDDDDNTPKPPMQKRSSVSALCKSKLTEIKGSCLYQVPISETHVNQKYGDVFKLLANQGVIPMGLFRIPAEVTSGDEGDKSDHRQSTSNKLPYVYTNPDKDVVLRKGDKVFCLSLRPIYSFDKPSAIMTLHAVTAANNSAYTAKRGNIVLNNGGIRSDGQPPTSGNRPRASSAVNAQEMQLRQLEDRLAALAADYSRKLGDIYTITEQILSQSPPTSSHSDTTQPLVLSTSKSASSPTPHLSLKDRRYSAVSNTTAETTATEASELRESLMVSASELPSDSPRLDPTAVVDISNDAVPVPQRPAILVTSSTNVDKKPISSATPNEAVKSTKNTTNSTAANGTASRPLSAGRTRPSANPGIVPGPSISSLSGLSLSPIIRQKSLRNDNNGVPEGSSAHRN